MKRGLLTLGFSRVFASPLKRQPGRPGAGCGSDPDIPVSHRDRVYSAEQFSNTVSVTDPSTISWSALSGSAIRSREISAAL